MNISRRHIFERRLGLFPSSFTASGELVTDTYLGDYPHYIDGDRGLTGWMLLSRHKPVTASSSLENLSPEQAVDEDIRTWWSAKTGDPGEWLQIDLGAEMRIDAVQINFADQDSTGKGISTDVYKYVVETSNDARSWKSVIDASTIGRDAPHDYEVLPRSEHARYIRVRNIHSPDNSKFSLYDLRVFGKGAAPVPARVSAGSGHRDPTDRRKATISWQPAANTEFYVVRLGARADELTQSYQVYDGHTSLTVASLNAQAKYYFAVDSVSDGGITKGQVVEPVQ
jgi:hypothetical protein